MKLGAVGNARRSQRQLPAADEGLSNREREEEVGFSEDVVVEEIVGAGAESVGVERPSAEGDGDPELVLFVPLAVERNEAARIRHAQLHQRTGGSQQGWRLVVLPVEGAERPTQTRDGDSCTEARADRIFGDAATGEVSRTQTGGKSQPGERLEFVVEKERGEAAGEATRDRRMSPANCSGCSYSVENSAGRRWSRS